MTSAAAIAAAKLGAAMRELRQVPRAWRLVLDASGRRTYAWLGLVAVQGLVAPAFVLLSRALIDAFATALRDGTATAGSPLLLSVCGMATILVAGEVIRIAAAWAQRVQARRVEDHVNGLIQKQAVEIDLAFYECPGFHDHLHRARDEARYRPAVLLANAGELLTGLISLTALAVILLPYGGWVAFALLASALPAFAVLLRFAVEQHRWRTRVTADERRAGYYDWLLTATDAAAEVRAYSLGDRLRRAFRALRQRLAHEELAIASSRAIAELAASLAALAVAAGCVAWVAWRAIQGAATPGDVALFYAAFMHGQKTLHASLSSIGTAYQNILFLGDLFTYLDLRPNVVDPAEPSPFPNQQDRAGVDVAFRGVAFNYPGAHGSALRGLDLHVRAGQVAAVVGANGAGKSTLVKLLCRLYDPHEGIVEIGGVDVRRLRIEDVRDAVTVLFQSASRYEETVARNIDIADRASPQEVEHAARVAGAAGLIASLPRRYDTPLGRWVEEGTDLSAGEWQRIALARAILRRAPVLVLDEPTSAMDSWSEARWMERLRAAARGSTTLVITHRFTTAMRADVIFVMHEGRVIESGTHDALVASGGRYAESWELNSRSPRTPAAATPRTPPPRPHSTG